MVGVHVRLYEGPPIPHRGRAHGVVSGLNTCVCVTVCYGVLCVVCVGVWESVWEKGVFRWVRYYRGCTRTWGHMGKYMCQCLSAVCCVLCAVCCMLCVECCVLCVGMERI